MNNNTNPKHAVSRKLRGKICFLKIIFKFTFQGTYSVCAKLLGYIYMDCQICTVGSDIYKICLVPVEKRYNRTTVVNVGYMWL